MTLYRILKRGTDLVVATIALAVLAPLLVPIMIALRLTGEGEVFYRQRRHGYRNQMFDILKFATMLKDSPNLAGGIITLRDDPRVLPLGKFLRQTKINELPQLLNILRGEMTLVGPRPLMPWSFDKYPPEAQAVVYLSPPGLTGIGSLLFRDEEGLISRPGVDPEALYSEQIYPYKGQLEIWYYRNRGVMTDVKILLLTAWYLFAPESKLVWSTFPNLPLPPAGLGIHAPSARQRVSAPG